MEKFLPLYVAGDLAGRRAARLVTNHLATCERCRALAHDYDASRDLVRDAATLPPDFDGAFYEELRRSVLDEIKRTRPGLAPPVMRARVASLFNARFAYAASLALIIFTVAALSLHSYVGQTPVGDAQTQRVIAVMNGGRNATPAAATSTPLLTQATRDARQTLSPTGESARENAKRGAQEFAKSSSSKRRASYGNAQNETQRIVDSTRHNLVRARRNPLAPIVAATTANKEEIARSSSSNGDGTNAAHEVSRIEIQTSDPNIRIIWLSPKPDAVAEPLK